MKKNIWSGFTPAVVLLEQQLVFPSHSPPFLPLFLQLSPPHLPPPAEIPSLLPPSQVWRIGFVELM